MSRDERLIERVKSVPSDLTWNEMVKFLDGFGYELKKPGKTSGSARCFVAKGLPKIFLHKNHPGNVVKRYQIRQIVSVLDGEGLL